MTGSPMIVSLLTGFARARDLGAICARSPRSMNAVRSALLLSGLLASCKSHVRTPDPEPASAPVETAAPATEPTPAAPTEPTAQTVDRSQGASNPANDASAAPQTDPVRELPRSAPESLGEDPLRKAAKAAIDQGEYSRARDVIEQLLVGSRLDEGAQLLRSGNAKEALAVLEDVHRDAPGRADLLVPFAEASLEVGVELGEASLVERALHAFSERRDDPESLFGASRAATVLGRTNDALLLAREGCKRLEPRRSFEFAKELPERTYATAVLNAYHAATAASAPEATELRAECESALARALGAHHDDLRTWADAGAWFQSDGQLDEAKRVYEHGLDRAPNDAGMLDALWQVASTDGGSDQVLRTFEKFRGTHSEVARAIYFCGRARLELALEHLSPAAVTDLEQAERELARSAELEPSYSEDVSHWRALCRGAVGRAKLEAGDLAGARAAFESTAELFDGALDWGWTGKLETAATGLERVAAKLRDAKDLAGASAIYDGLFAKKPDDPTVANNAGFFALSLGDELRLAAADCASAAKGAISDAKRLAELRKLAHIDASAAGAANEKSAFERASSELSTAAMQRYETAYAAYSSAVQIAPDDVRVSNDAAMLLVHFLKRDWDRAEELLQHAIAVGKAQLEDPALDAQRKNELLNAYGDAHENLGVLYLQHKRDPAAARRYFERANEIGPDPRPMVKEVWLKQCDEAEKH